jgi:hypothetical protein
MNPVLIEEVDADSPCEDGDGEGDDETFHKKQNSEGRSQETKEYL